MRQISWLHGGQSFEIAASSIKKIKRLPLVLKKNN